MSLASLPTRRRRPGRLHGGADYVRPTVEHAAGVAHRLPEGRRVANLKWWEQFGDPVLDSWSRRSLRDNATCGSRRRA